MLKISDQEWKMISSSCGLPSEARPEVEEAIEDYRGDGAAEYHQVSPETRAKLASNRKLLKRLYDGLTGLDACRDFRCFHAGDSNTSLAAEVDKLCEIGAALTCSAKRLGRRSRKNWFQMKLMALFVRLLEIRSAHLHIDAPTQSRETSVSGRFRLYLELCLELAEPYANRIARAETFKRGIELAVESFQFRKTDPIYSWEWEDLFPQSYAALRMSTRFLNS